MNGELVHIKFTNHADTNNGIGEGKVSNIISEWKKGLTVQNMNR